MPPPSLFVPASTRVLSVPDVDPVPDGLGADYGTPSTPPHDWGTTETLPAAEHPVTAAILADAEAFGPFYEDVLQPFLASWAKREAEATLRGASIHQIDTGAWENVVKQFCRHRKLRVTAEDRTTIALDLTRRFAAEWEDYAAHAIDDLTYPEVDPPASVRDHWIAFPVDAGIRGSRVPGWSNPAYVPVEGPFTRREAENFFDAEVGDDGRIATSTGKLLPVRRTERMADRPAKSGRTSGPGRWPRSVRRSNDQKGYAFYVVRPYADGSLRIEGGGWEYRSDADDALKDAPRPEGLKVYARRYLVQRGCDPADDLNWGPLGTTEKLSIGAVTAPIAAGLSYQRNRSVGMAVLHGLVAPAYLAYRGAQALASRTGATEKLSVGHWDPETSRFVADGALGVLVAKGEAAHAKRDRDLRQALPTMLTMAGAPPQVTTAVRRWLGEDGALERLPTRIDTDPASDRRTGKRADVRAARTRIRHAGEHGWYLGDHGWYQQNEVWRANELAGGNGGREPAPPAAARRLDTYVAGGPDPFRKSTIETMRDPATPRAKPTPAVKPKSPGGKPPTAKPKPPVTGRPSTPKPTPAGSSGTKRGPVAYVPKRRR